MSRKTYIIRAFEALFPKVWNQIENFNKVDRLYLPNQLQKIESKIFQKAITVLYSQNAEGLFIRLHDSIITTEEYRENVQEAIGNTCYEELHYLPKCKTELFTLDKASILTRNVEHPKYLDKNWQSLINYVNKKRELYYQEESHGDVTRRISSMQWYHFDNFINRVPMDVLTRIRYRHQFSEAIGCIYENMDE